MSSPDLYLLKENESTDYPKAGWYHRDECEQLHGPFETEQKANEALKEYCKWL